MDDSVVRDLQSIIFSTFSPNVMVATSPEVDEILQRANIKRLTDVLRPYGMLRRKIQLKNLNDQPYEVSDFQVRFMEMTDLRMGGLTPKVLQHLASVVSNCAVDEERRYGTVAFRDKAEIPQFLKECAPFIPWFNHYRSSFLNSLGISEHEFFDHPVACVTVASLSNVTESFAIFDQLYNQQQPPPLLQEEFIDQNIFIMRVILDDGKDDRKIVDAKVQKMKQLFGTNCFLLRLNSLEKRKSQESDQSVQHHLLTNEDLTRIEEFVVDLVVKGIIPHMDKTMRSLNEQVMATRRGFRNQMKYWLRPFGGGNDTKKTKTDGPSDYGDTKIYAINSAGGICRQLADFAFMLRDYDSAQTNYKTCARDFQNDKALKHLGGTFEMIGLCSIMLEPVKKDAESELQKAYDTYMRAGASSYRFGLRTTLFLASIFKARRNYSEAAAVLIRGSDTSEDPLAAALLQEQAAFCYLYNNPPMHRRFAYRLIAAGDLFFKGYQLNHALGCFLTGYAIYENKEWALLDDNLRFAIARVSFLLGHTERANQFFQQLLISQARPSLQQSSAQQNSYLREFLYTFKKYALKSDTLAESPIPLIENEKVRVYLNCAYEAEPNQEDTAWKEMEDSLVNEEVYARWGVAVARKRALNVPIDSKERISVVNEMIAVESEIQNPLNVPLQLSSLQLVCWHGPQSFESEPNIVEYENDTVEVEPVNLLLGPGESKKIRLSITPQQEGYMKITGLGFYLARNVWARRDFKLKGKRLNDTRDQRLTKQYAPNNSTSVRICGCMPLLEISNAIFPDTILQGEIHRILLVFKNTGSLGLRNVKVRLSHPAFFTFGKKPTSSDDDESTLPASFEPFNIQAEKQHIVNPTIISLPIESLAPGESVTIPLWIRGVGDVGSYSFNFLFYYEPENKDQLLKYRLLRLSKDVRVVQSLKVSTLTNTSLKGLDAYLLGLEVENKQSTTAFIVKQITSISRFWQIHPLSYDESQLQTDGSIFTVGANQSSHLFFRITPIHKSALKEEHLDSHLVHSSLSLSKNSISTTAMPYYDFLLREKIIGQSQNATQTAVQANLFSKAPEKPPAKPPPPENAIDFMIFWETADGKHCGQDNVLSVVLHPYDVMAPELVIPESPLRFLINSPTKIIHDFSQKSFCIVPVTFAFKNTSLNSHASFLLECIKPSDVKEANDALGQTRSQFFWSGCTSYTVPELGPQEETRIDVNVCFAKPGVYNINRFRVVVSTPTVSGKIMYCPFQHLITVEKALNDTSEAG